MSLTVDAVNSQKNVDMVFAFFDTVCVMGWSRIIETLYSCVSLTSTNLMSSLSERKITLICAN